VKDIIEDSERYNHRGAQRKP